MTAPGRVYLVGAGPWDPALLTLRARTVLSRADLLIAGEGVHPAVMAHAPAAAERRAPAPDDAARLIERERAGHTAVRLWPGDPWMHASGAGIARALAATGVAFEVVPGVPEELAAATYAGIALGPLAVARAQAVSSIAELQALAADRLADGAPPETPVALIRWRDHPDPLCDVRTLASCTVSPPAPPLTVVVGDAVAGREALDWYARRPLHGRRVVVTRSGAQQADMAESLRELGAEVLALPTLAFEPPADPAPTHAALSAIDTYDWVVFTSANGVDHFLGAVYGRGQDVRIFRNARVACIGPATAQRLAERGIRPDLVPESYIAEGLIAALRAEGIEGRRFLIPRAEVAREVLPDTLRAEGAAVEVLVVYRSVAPPVDPTVRARVASGDVDVVTFTASSTVHHFCGLFSPAELAVIRRRVRAACIGPVTADTARERGLDIAVTADVYTVAGLVAALGVWARGE